MAQHEEAFIDAFVIREKRSRFRQLLANPKRRREVLERLNHSLDIDRSRATQLPGDHSPAHLEHLLRQHGAGTSCHVIADGLDSDGQELPLDCALTEIAQHDFGAVVSCIPGRLALYKEESPGSWWLLERTTT